MAYKIKVKELPQLMGEGNYAIDVMLGDLPRVINEYRTEYGMEMNPDFQRGHVWTREQEVKYVEFVLRGGHTALDFYFNHPHWMGSFEGTMVCVDGLQRITAILRFLNDEFPVFDGVFASEIEGLMRTMRYHFRIHVNSLENRDDVLRWYIEFNSGGTPHSREEIERVRGLISEK